MKLENLKIEISEISDDMDLIQPTWKVFDSETGEDVFPVSDEICIKAMHMMAYCANRIREALEYQRQLVVSSDSYISDFLKKKYEKRLQKSGFNPDVVLNNKSNPDGMGASQNKTKDLNKDG